MLLSMIMKTIPRSLRAFLALLVMLGSLSLVFTALQQLFVPGLPAGRMAMQLAVGLAIGLPATVFFYYFQTIDDKERHSRDEQGPEVLDKYLEAQKRDRIYRESSVTPVFTSHGGAVEPGKVAGTQKSSEKPAPPAA